MSEREKRREALLFLISPLQALLLQQHGLVQQA